MCVCCIKLQIKQMMWSIKKSKIFPVSKHGFATHARCFVLVKKTIDSSHDFCFKIEEFNTLEFWQIINWNSWWLLHKYTFKILNKSLIAVWSQLIKWIKQQRLGQIDKLGTKVFFSKEISWLIKRPNSSNEVNQAMKAWSE